MSQMIFSFDHHILELELENTTLHLRLAPAKPSSNPSYTYTTKLETKCMDARLNFVFSSIENIWKYISFYRQRALLIDFPRIQVENQLLTKEYQRNSLQNIQNSERKQIELPIAIRIILLQNIESLVGLNGEMTVETIEKKLSKTLKQNQELKVQLSESRAYSSSLEQKIDELRKKIELYEMERSRPIYQELPRKKIHVSEDIEEGQCHQNYSQEKQIWHQNGQQNLENSQNAQSDQGMKPSQTMNLNLNIDKISLILQNTEESKVNEQVMESHHIPHENHFNNSEVDKKADVLNGKASNDGSKKFTNSEENFEQAEMNQTEDARRVIEFAKKCFLSVGFAENGEERKGYVCIVCAKAFKDISYLEKHLVSRHQELAKNTQRELEMKLAQYKHKKEQEQKLETALKFYTNQN